MSDLGPDLEVCVPRASTKSFTIIVNTQAGNSVLMSKGVDNFAMSDVPDIAVIVIITGEEVATSLREGDGGDTTEDVGVEVLINLGDGTDIEQAASRVIGTSGEGVTVREEGDGVNIGLVSSERLNTLAYTNTSAKIPELSRSIDGTRDKCVAVDRDTHNITIVTLEALDGSSSVDIPQNAGGVTRGGKNFIIIYEAAAREITFVVLKFSTSVNSHITIIYSSILKTIDRAEVIETTTCHESTRLGVGAGHDP